MTDRSEDEQDTIETAELSADSKTDFPLVWLLPLIALVISGWLIYKSASEKGPVITIDFPTAEGLEVDKTKIRYLNVDIGKVTAITINDDQKTIQITAQMNNTAENYLNEGTDFWVVKPQVGLSGISGLSTLLSGYYIELKPGTGKSTTHFVGLSDPPVLRSQVDGKQFILETNELGSMRPGAPIHFHGILAGEVLGHELNNNGTGIRLTIFINSPFDKFVRKNTRFWLDSGIDLSAGTDGFKVRTGPLIALLNGGIAFRVSPKDSAADIKPENSNFPLFENYEESTQIAYTNTLKYVMYFNGSVRGLKEGAPVQLRGIPIGRVTDITLELHKGSAELWVPVTVELEPDRIESVTDKEETKATDISDKDVMDRLIAKGLRAQLQVGSLVTGQLLIDLDFHPESKFVTHDNHSVFPEFPTVASSLEEIAHSTQIIMDKVAKLPLDKMISELNTTLITLQDTSKAATNMLNSANGTILSAKSTLGNADGTLTSANQLFKTLEPGSSGYYEFHTLLQELTKAAKSVRQLSDYLEQHPESLLRGKEEDNHD
jgi:paraquat-inducible protein B